MASTSRRHVAMPEPAPRLAPGAPPPPPPPGRDWPAVPASPRRRPALFADVLPAREVKPPEPRLTAGRKALLRDIAAFVCIAIVFGAPAVALWMRTSG